jgi:diguanylate cyclase (GGDEF)-like protein
MLTYKAILEFLDVGVAIVHNGKSFANMNIAFKTYLDLKSDVKDINSLLSLIDSDSISITKFNLFIKHTDRLKSSYILNLNSGIVLHCTIKRLSTIDTESLDLLTIQDITSHELRIRQLTIESQQDELTGVANRRKFEYEFSKLYEFVQRTKITGALMLLDLDNFKTINDRFGHSAGDAILKQVCLALFPVIRNYELLARVGGDEFAILVSHSGEQAIERLVKEVPLALKSIIINANDKNSAVEFLKVSMGTCIFPLEDLSYQAVYEIADKNMYEHKMKKIRTKNH